MLKELPNEAVERYIDSGVDCPKCGEPEIAAVDEDAFDSRHVWRGVKCGACKARFTETYTLSWIEENEPSEDDEHDPHDHACTYEGNNSWSCGYVDLS